MSASKLIGAALVAALCALPAYAQTMDDYVSLVARTQRDMATVVNGQTMTFTYVGLFNGCHQVAVLRPEHPQRGSQNFEVCADAPARDKHTVSPAWPVDHSARTLLAELVSLAVRQGHAQGVDSNGYTILAERIPGYGACPMVDVMVTYSGDLVERTVKEIPCQ